MKKLQTQILSLIIMTGIVITLVGVAYIWGSPMIEKRTVYTQYISAEKFMNDLNDKITKVATTCTTAGGCTNTLNIPAIEGAGIRIINADNTLYFQFPSSQRMLSEEEIALNTPYTSEPADYGTAPPGLLKTVGVTEADFYLIRFILHYRELDDEDSNVGYKINITGKVSGNNQIIMTYTGTTQIPGGAATGGDLTVSNVELNVI